jgi:hypothetical protein
MSRIRVAALSAIFWRLVASSASCSSIQAASFVRLPAVSGEGGCGIVSIGLSFRLCGWVTKGRRSVRAHAAARVVNEG